MYWLLNALFVLFVLMCNFVVSLESSPNIIDYDMNDIFDIRLTKFEPFLNQLPQYLNISNPNSEFINASRNFGSNFVNGSDLKSALEAMKHYRQIMSSLMARNYLSMKIMDDEPLSSDKNARRIGLLLQNDTQQLDLQNYANDFSQIHEQNHNQQPQNLHRSSFIPKFQKIHKANRRTDNIDPVSPNVEESDEDYFEDGDITGYALSANPSENTNFQDSMLPNNQQWPQLAEGSSLSHKNLFNQAFNKKGYEHGYDDYETHYQPEMAHSHRMPLSRPQQTKQITIKDITDIALTTLAFLSFGMFFLQVLMCITMAKDDYNDTMMLPMEVTDTGEQGTDDIEEIRRKRRSATFLITRLSSINEIARRALSSIDAVEHIRNDNITCYYQTLCKSNRFSKPEFNHQKLWMSIWSLGISWTATKFSTDKFSNSITIPLQSLKAVADGLGNTNCQKIYASVCEK